MTAKKPTVSLVLGSGGARGLAHIGVIEVLSENGFDIRSISGSSIGALIGGIYATGQLDVYANWVRALERMDVLRLLDFTFGRPGLLKGDKIINVLKELIGDTNIEDLPISFTAVATNLDSQKEIWLNHGPLFEAIRASIAIPTIFTPFNLNGQNLVDGGLVNPIPIAPTLREQNELTIAVNLSGKHETRFNQPAEKKEPAGQPDSYHTRITEFIEGLQKIITHKDPEELGVFDLISKSYDIMQNTVGKLKLAAYSPDIVIEVAKNVCTFYEFDRADELIRIGRQTTEEVLAREKF